MVCGGESEKLFGVGEFEIRERSCVVSISVHLGLYGPVCRRIIEKEAKMSTKIAIL